MNALLCRRQSHATLGAVALFVLLLASCQRQAPQPGGTATLKTKAPSETQVAQSSQPKTDSTRPTAPVAAPPAAADSNAILKTATTTTGAGQYTAIDDLGERHEDASVVLPGLQKLLSSADAQVRWRAARALGDYGALAAPAAPALRGLLADKDPIVKYHAIVSLGKTGDGSDETLDALMTLVTDPDARVARVAIAALQNLEPGPDRAAAALEKALQSDDAAVTAHALEAIVARGADAVPMLNAALARPKTAYLACAAIEAIGPDAAGTVPSLVELIGKTEHSQVETQALLALARIGSEAKAASPAIIPLLEHANDTTVPVAAAYALGSIGATDADAALRQALAKDANPFLQMVAAWSLAKIHPSDETLMKQAVERLTQELASKNAHIRATAAKGLEMLHAPPELVAPALLAIANEPDPETHEHVVDALASLGEKIVPKAGEALQKPEMRELAVEVLSRLGPKASGAVQPLIGALDGASPELRTQLQLALASIGPAAAPATDQLAEAIASDDVGIRESALFALRQIGPAAKAAVPKLVARAEADDSFEAMAAAWAVAEIAPDDAAAAGKIVPHLIRGLSNPGDQTRMESAIALGAFGPAAKPAVEALTEAARDDRDPAVRDAAAEALTRISAGQ